MNHGVLATMFPEMINREPLIEEHADTMVFENKNPYTKPSCHHLTQSQVADMFVPTFIRLEFQTQFLDRKRNDCYTSITSERKSS